MRYAAVLFAVLLVSSVANAQNLVADPSFEAVHPEDAQSQHWDTWWITYASGGTTAWPDSSVARTGQYSCKISGAINGIGGESRLHLVYPFGRVNSCPPGRYKLKFFIRGIGAGNDYYGRNFYISEKINFKFFSKTGTFGWSPVEYVVDNEGAFKIFLGYRGTGEIWIDDVSFEPTTDEVHDPIIGPEESPVIVEPRPTCAPAALSERKMIDSFEDGKAYPPWTDSDAVVSEHATDGNYSMRCKTGKYVLMLQDQDWNGWDYFRSDIFNPSSSNVEMTIEIRDALGGSNYKNRVNWKTILTPGPNTISLPAVGLYCNEKVRPGRLLFVDQITHLFLSFGQSDEPYVYVDNVRLIRISKPTFPGLMALDFGPVSWHDAGNGNQVFPGFVPVYGAFEYVDGRNFGFTPTTKWWREYNVLHPDHLYQDWVGLQNGAFRYDVPNGKYHVWAVWDMPGGYWGESQVYTTRSLKVNGRMVEEQAHTFETYQDWYYRDQETHDTAGMDVWQAYQSNESPTYNPIKTEVEVTDGKIELDFDSSGGWAITLSALVIYPDDQRVAGEAFLSWVEAQRKWQFDHIFCKPIVQKAKEVNLPPEITLKLARGEESSMSFITNDLDVSISGFDRFPGRILPGHWQDKVQRVTQDGTVYKIAPKYWRPGPAKQSPADVFVRIQADPDAEAGAYSGTINGISATITVLPFSLEPLSDVYAGPFDCTIDSTWIWDDNRSAWDEAMFRKSVDTMTSYGFNALSGIPFIEVNAQGAVVRAQSERMAYAKVRGIQFACNYGESPSLPYKIYSGSSDQEMLERVWTGVDAHANAEEWIPVAWSLCDEPGDKEATAANARAHDAIQRSELTTFMGFTSYESAILDAMPITALGIHDEASIARIHAAGHKFSFYNGGTRWTYGRYMKALVDKYGLFLRLNWHWNAVAGNPYYGLDAREDDYCWFNSDKDGNLIPSHYFLTEMLPGLNDYRYLATLQKMLTDKPDEAAQAVYNEMVNLTAGTDRDKVVDYQADRDRITDTILALIGIEPQPPDPEPDPEPIIVEGNKIRITIEVLE